jgi:hypothetical protein
MISKVTSPTAYFKNVKFACHIILENNEETAS